MWSKIVWSFVKLTTFVFNFFSLLNLEKSGHFGVLWRNARLNKKVIFKNQRLIKTLLKEHIADIFMRESLPQSLQYTI